MSTELCILRREKAAERQAGSVEHHMEGGRKEGKRASELARLVWQCGSVLFLVAGRPRRLVLERVMVVALCVPFVTAIAR